MPKKHDEDAYNQGREARLAGKSMVKHMYHACKPDGSRDATVSNILNTSWVDGWKDADKELKK